MKVLTKPCGVSIWNLFINCTSCFSVSIINYYNYVLNVLCVRVILAVRVLVGISGCC